MSSLLEKTTEYIEQNKMLSPGDVVVTGVSGGADSVCLLLLLSALKNQIPFRLLVVHVHHGIRREADQDAAFVRELCERLHLPFFLSKVDVTELSHERGLSVEETGRQVRYEIFRETLKKEAPEAAAGGYGKIAVAHNLNDRAETMLFHLFRGSGLPGLCSIRPVRMESGISVIRPLLAVSREEIESFLTGIGMGWREDSTNAEDHYTRNRIRHHVLPFAEQEIASGAVEHMCHTAELLSETEDFVQQETARAYQSCGTELQDGGICFSAEKFLRFHIVLQERMLLLAMEKLAGVRKDITAAHIRNLLSLFKKPENREFSFPYGIHAARVYGKVILKKSASETEQHTLTAVRVPHLKPGGESFEAVTADGAVMEFKVFSHEKTINIPENQYTKWFDYDKIEKSLEIRTRASGDYLTVNEAFSRKSVQDYMVNEKIPRAERDRIPLLADGQHILWVTGYRISSYYKINENTKHILQVQLRGGHIPCRNM